MNSESDQDIYAGDAAWEEWFTVCSVPGCQKDHMAALSKQVCSAMARELARHGVERQDSKDAIEQFDSYFLLSGTNMRKKPLKQWLLAQMQMVHGEMKGLVCGKVFGSSGGCIRDIARDWVELIKGWKSHSRIVDGKRKRFWEHSGDEEDTSEQAGQEAPLPDDSYLDAQAHEIFAGKLLEVLAKKLKLEKPTVSLLFYAKAMNIALTTPELQTALPVGKSRAYTLQTRCLELAEKFLMENDVPADSQTFALPFLALCEKNIPVEVMERLRNVSER